MTSSSDGFGKIYVVDGLDGSGKSTQTERVYQALQSRGEQVQLISFPDYQEDSSVLVRMYLNGDFGTDANSVNAYAASTFYAVDRYAAYQRHWKAAYEAGQTVIATRYVSSNAIHQMGKLPEKEWDGFLAWLSDFEYNKLGLPKPNKVIFLDMPREVADKQLLKRYHGDTAKLDIHEKDRVYLERCQQTAAYAAKAEGWDVISCADGVEPLPIDAITDLILKKIFGDSNVC